MMKKNICNAIVVLGLVGLLGCEGNSSNIGTTAGGNAGSHSGTGGSHSGGSSGTAGMGNAGTGGEHPSLTCPKGRGPEMVPIPMPNGGAICIDQSEVTRAQYSDFLADIASGTKVEDEAICEHLIDGHEPDSFCMNEPSVCKGNCDNHPQVCINWCNAWAFCKWAGKRLCGKVGGGQFDTEEQEPVDGFRDSARGEWVHACSVGQEPGDLSQGYPYGLQYDAQACNGYENSETGCDGGTCTTREVMSLQTCQATGAYSGVFDLSGNVAELIDACTDNTAVYSCIMLGGSFALPMVQIEGPARWASCGYGWGPSRDLGSNDVGFRCCADGE